MKNSVVISDGSFISTTAPLQGDYAVIIKQAAQIGFDAIQLTVTDPRDIDVDGLLSLTRQYGVSISSLATGRAYSVEGLSLGAEDESVRQQASQRMKDNVDLAHKVGGAQVIIGAIRGWSHECQSLEIYLQQFGKTMCELLPYAEQKQVNIILEANDHTETDVFLKIKETADYIRSFNSPNFKLQLDTMHILYEYQDDSWYQEILDEADLITQVDISDDQRLCPDGKHFDFPRFIKALKEINYQGYLVFEFQPSPPEDAAKVGFQYIQQLVADL